VESKKSAAPAFSFGARHQGMSKTYGPGLFSQIKTLE
jgi:hypothetical protein